MGKITINTDELIGKKFGKLTVIRKIISTENKTKTLVECECECGNIKNMQQYLVFNGHIKSCGCTKKPRNLKTDMDKRIYIKWKQMRNRVNYAKGKMYARYKQRGITVCDEWNNDFDRFKNDMGDIPFKDAELDRIDNDKGYYKENCRWVTREQNRINKSSIDGSTSKYKGVCWNKQRRMWESTIHKNGRRYHLGFSNNEQECAKLYNNKALELFGEYAYLNKFTS